MAGLSNSYPQYANGADLEAYLGEPIDEITAMGLLQDASGAIRDWTRTAIYAVSENGYTPVDTTLANAYHDATILQAAALHKSGIAPGVSVAGQAPAIQSKSLGGRSITYSENATATQARDALLGGALDPRAVAVLRGIGLLGGNVLVGGERSYDILARQWVSN